MIYPKFAGFSFGEKATLEGTQVSGSPSWNCRGANLKCVHRYGILTSGMESSTDS